MTDNNTPRLFMAGVPITEDYKDLTPSLIQRIKDADFVIGEERKTIMRFLAAADEREKEHLLLNEHSTKEEKEVVLDRLKNCKSAVLFSDAGTPAVADPGFDFVNKCYENGVDVKSAPGPSSITSALSVSGFYSERFYFAGFPPKDGTARNEYFERIRKSRDTSVIFERPYALNKTVEEISGYNRRVCVAVNLGFEDEEVFRGDAADIPGMLPDKLKKPFVIIVEGRFKKGRP